MKLQRRLGETSVRVLIAGGGTGGHLFPGLAVAEELLQRRPGSDIFFVTGHRRIESEILDRYGFSQSSINVEGLKGRGWIKGIMGIWRLPHALFQSFRIIRMRSPQLVVGVGGYSSGPVCLAAKIMGIPTAIHEQNTIPGFTNRLLSRIVDRVLISFDESKNWFPGRPVFLTGNPVRKELLMNRCRHNDISKVFTVLVTGGSQGAMAINDASVKAMAIIKASGKAFRVIHQTGETDFTRMRAAYANAGIQAETRPFIQDMARAYRDADIVVSRAGATTISELAVLGIPSILIPFPYATNRHQEINARVLSDMGGAEILLQKDLSGERLADVLMGYMDNRTALKKMGEKAMRKGQPDAASAIVDQLEAIMFLS